MPAIFRHFRFSARRLCLPCLISFLFFSLMTLNALGQHEENNSSAFLRLNEVNSHATRHFFNHFSQATGVKWTRDDYYYIASFNADHSKARVYYKYNGNFAFCIKNYLVDELKPELKSAIFKKFPGCQIRLVTELTGQDKQAFYVNIKYGDYLKTLCCNDEGIEITENIMDAGI